MVVDETLLKTKLVEYTNKFDEVCAEKYAELFQNDAIDLLGIESIDEAVEALAVLYHQVYFTALKAMFLRDIVESKLQRLADDSGFIPTSEAWKPDSVNPG